MKKAFKVLLYIALGFIAITIVFVIINLSANSGSNTAPVNKAELTSFNDLTIKSNIKSINDDFIIIGDCNYPNGTKLSITTYDNKKTTAQSEAIVRNGYYIVSFGSKVLSSDNLEITCYINDIWQSEKVLEKLSVIKTDDNSIVSIFNLNAMKKTYFAKIIGISSDYEPILTNVESLKDLPFMNVKRMNMNLIVDKEVTGQELEQELKYKIFEIMTKEPDAHTALVRCFKPNEDVLFKKALFSPTGDWSNVEESKPFKDYSLVIQ